MQSKSYEFVAHWTEDNLEDLPSEESDNYEYKSSKIQHEPNFKKKLKKIFTMPHQHSGIQEVVFLLLV